MCVSEALVAAVDAVVHSVADVRRVDTLSTGQTVERAVAGATPSATDRRSATTVVGTDAAATTGFGSRAHRTPRHRRLSVTVNQRLAPLLLPTHAYKR